tara:strand:+ start:1224 stop:2084 length:861 start_codon:yes stop_codon:yes gene_type:complete
LKKLSFKNFKQYLNETAQKLKDFDLNSAVNKLKEFQIEDLKNIDLKRLLYKIKQSNYTKPSIGIFSAAFLTIFILIPQLISLKTSFKKIEQYKKESNELPLKIAELKDEKIKLIEISKLMSEINSSFIKKENTIFLTKLLNEASKKSNVKIDSFSPILKADSSNLCKTSLNQKNSKRFKRKSRKRIKKGGIESNFYEISFNSDYLDIINFLKEIQLYDLVIIPHCLEVNSEQLSSSKDINKDSNSILIPLNKKGIPLESYIDISNKDLTINNGNVLTRIVLKIPTN